MRDLAEAQASGIARAPVAQLHRQVRREDHAGLGQYPIELIRDVLRLVRRDEGLAALRRAFEQDLVLDLGEARSGDETLDALDFVTGEVNNILNRYRQLASVGPQQGRPDGSVIVVEIVGPDLRQDQAVEIPPLVAADRFAFEDAPQHFMVAPVENGDLPNMIDVRIVAQQMGALAGNGPGDLGLRIIIAKLPRQDRRVKAITIGAELTEKNAIHQTNPRLA